MPRTLAPPTVSRSSTPPKAVGAQPIPGTLRRGGAAAILVLVVVGGCVGGGFWVARSGMAKEWTEKLNPGTKPLEVRLEKPRRGDLIRTISAPGTIDPRTKVDISAQVSARIVALPYREGTRIKKGDVLVRLDAVDLAAALDSAKARHASEQARLEGVRASMENADREMRRRKELLDTKDISQEEFDSAKTALDQLKSQFEQTLREIDIAVANIKRAEKDLGNTTIQAPIDGVITKLDAEVGELVVVGTLNNAGSVIMQIADLSDMLMKAKVDESNIAPVLASQKCRVFINAYPGKTFSGQVERVRPTRMLDKDGTAYFETEIQVDLPKDNGLRGMLANVDIEVQTMRDVVKVPTQAILDRLIEDLPGDLVKSSTILDRNKKFARVVYSVKDGKAQPVVVNVGLSDLTDTVIVAGVGPEDTIITGPYKALTAMKADQAVAEKKDDKKDEKPKGKDGEGESAKDEAAPAAKP